MFREKVELFCGETFLLLFSVYMKVFFVNVGNLEENKQKCTPPHPPPTLPQLI